MGRPGSGMGFKKKGGLTVKPDGLVKEKICQTVEIRAVKLPNITGYQQRVIGYLNIHHSALDYSVPLAGTYATSQVYVNMPSPGASGVLQNYQFYQLASSYEKYAVYGLGIKIFLKQFSPQNGVATERYIRACYVATTADKGSDGLISRTPLSERDVQSKSDFRVMNSREAFQKYYKVGKWNKGTAGQFWYDCSGFNFPEDTTINLNDMNLTDSGIKGRTTQIWVDTNSAFSADAQDGEYVGEAVISYYVMFKDRKALGLNAVNRAQQILVSSARQVELEELRLYKKKKEEEEAAAAAEALKKLAAEQIKQKAIEEAQLD